MSALLTAPELLNVIQELDYEAELSTEIDETFGEYSSITITAGEEHFWIIPLGYGGPYFEDFSIQSFIETSSNPHLVANDWNEEDHLTVATVLYDPDTELPIIHNGSFIVRLRLAPFYVDELSDTITEKVLRIFDEDYAEFVEEFGNATS